MFNRWKLQDFAPGAGVAAGAEGAAFDDSTWLDIAAPGDVHRTLIDAGRIPDPFYDRDETACAWMEEREWWYRLRFTPPGPVPVTGERTLLTFHGLDTFATVWLNGVELGRHANMFRPATFDVTARLRPGAENTLAICFDRPLDHIAGKTISTWGRNPERTPMRKAQFGFGWDWGPRLPTLGIWRPVELRRQRQAAIIGVHFGTIELTRAHDRALVAIRVEAERFAGEEPLTIAIRLTPPGATEETAALEQTLILDSANAALEGTAYLTVDHPTLWWTHDLGDPALYNLTVTLRRGDDELDRSTAQVGIRTLTLDQSPDPDERGTRFFRFVLNGVPIFAKGGDWIPCDSFVGAIPPERYTTLLETARDANMNMLRIWGGGVYEHDIFYDECDRLGLLIWHDFMFACAMYPEDDLAFIAEVNAEARYQVRRLRSHPSLALWCGNNENQWIHDTRYWDEPNPPAYGALYYDHILPRAVAELDGRTPYWPGSPYGGNDHNSMDEGNRHNWDAWHGQSPRHFGEKPSREISEQAVSYLRYAEDRGRFISEFGLHAAPVVETLRRVIPADQLYHHSPAMDWHNKDDPKDKGDLLMQSVTGVPQDLPEYITFSQLAQAEGLKFGIEHYRRRKPHCSGTLVWQFDDCWPVQSWSVLDYYGFGKAGYFYLKRVFAPVLASFKSLPDGSVELWLANDALAEFAETITVRLGTFTGSIAWEEQLAVNVPGNSSQSVGHWDCTQLGAAPDRYLAVHSPGERFPANRHFFVPIKDLTLPAAQPSISVTPMSAHELRVELAAPADAYALFTHLAIPSADARLSDNYFDLEPGSHHTVTITSRASALDPSQITLGWWSTQRGQEIMESTHAAAP
jgi:beta-mannosidase